MNTIKAGMMIFFIISEFYTNLQSEDILHAVWKWQIKRPIATNSFSSRSWIFNSSH